MQSAICLPMLSASNMMSGIDSHGPPVLQCQRHDGRATPISSVTLSHHPCTARVLWQAARTSLLHSCTACEHQHRQQKLPGDLTVCQRQHRSHSWQGHPPPQMLLRGTRGKPAPRAACRGAAAAPVRLRTARPQSCQPRSVPPSATRPLQ